MLIFVISVNFVSAELSDGIESAYLMNGTGNAFDYSGNGRDMTESGIVPEDTGYAPTIDDKARGVFGASIYLSRAEPSFFQVSTANFTVNYWLRWVSFDSAQNIWNARLNAGHYWIHEYSAANGLNLGTSGGGFVQYTTAMTDGTWYMVTITYDATNGNISLYVNGSLAHQDTRTATSGDTADFTVGVPAWATTSDTADDLIIDELVMWNRTLSTAEVAELKTRFFPFGALSPPVIVNTTYNLTTFIAGQNSTRWRGDNEHLPISTYDTTPTITFDTNMAAHCRISNSSMNWTTAGAARNCTTTGGTSHTCTLAAVDGIKEGMSYQSLYAACIDTTYMYESASSTSGSLNISVVAATNLTSGIVVDGVLRANTSVAEGEDFNFFANWTYESNKSAVNDGWCNYTAFNVSYEEYNSTGLNKSICAAITCDYNNVYSQDFTEMPTSNIINDVFKIKICRYNNIVSTATISTNCSIDTQTLTNGDVSLCEDGYSTIEIKNNWCTSKKDFKINITSTGNYKQRVVNVDQYVYVDRFLNTSANATFNTSLGLWMSNEYEHYSAGNRTVYWNCQHNKNDIQNTSSSLNYATSNSFPSSAFVSIEDWVFGTQYLHADTLTKYPLYEFVNVSAYCGDDDVDLTGSYVNLTNSSGGFIRTLPFTTPGMTWNLGISNFSYGYNKWYNLNMRCQDNYGHQVFKTASFNVSNLAPTAYFINATGGLYAASPTFAFYCYDPENNFGLLGANIMTYLYANGTHLATNGMMLSNSTISYSTAILPVGTYQLELLCWDSLMNSTNTTISYTYSSMCLSTHTGIIDGTRYQDDTLNICSSCTNGINLSGAWYRINDYDLHTISNISGCYNMTLERGWNRIELITEGNGFNVTDNFHVWAKKMDSTVFDYPVIWFMIIISTTVMIIGVVLNVPLLGSVGGLLIGLVGYELLNISMYFGGLTIIIGILLALYFGIKRD
jgi:hypothetical protein